MTWHRVKITEGKHCICCAGRATMQLIENSGRVLYYCTKHGNMRRKVGIR